MLPASLQSLSKVAASVVFRADSVAIGERAHEALAASNGIASPLTAFPNAPYYEASGEVLWLGTQLIAMHPRAVLIAAPVPLGVRVRFAILPKPRELPHPPQRHRNASGRIAASVQTLRDMLRSASPRGFGALLAGCVPDFPLNHVEPQVRALARAYASDDVDAVCHASALLLGIGPGLTPSGDDLVGAALFARRLLAPDDRRWRRVAQRLSENAKRVGHPISAALLRDLLYCQSYAPLHALVEALLVGDDECALNATRVLVEIGHCSGWDMLTGLIIGLAGEDAMRG